MDSLLSSFVFLKPLVDPPCSTEEKNKTNATSEDEQTIHALYSVGISSADARKNSGNESQPLFLEESPRSANDLVLRLWLVVQGKQRRVYIMLLIMLLFSK